MDRIAPKSLLAAFADSKVKLPLKISDIDAGVVVDDDGVDVLVVDSNGTRPYLQVEAVAMLIVSAVNSAITTPFSSSDRPLADLIEASKVRLAAMSEEERQAMWQAQRESFARAMSTPCEHGVLDFEQCEDCRNQAPKDFAKRLREIMTPPPATREPGR